MSGQEISTAVQHGGKPIILLFKNNMYGTIRMHQEREHPFRVVGTDLVNPDFVVMAQLMGAHARRVIRNEEFAPALDRALAAARPALIELCTDPEQISRRMSITELRAMAKGGSRPSLRTNMRELGLHCANAVGAAVAQVCGEVDQIFHGASRTEALSEATNLAKQRAVAAGASSGILMVVDEEDIPIAYLPGNAMRVRVRIVGDIGVAATK